MASAPADDGPTIQDGRLILDPSSFPNRGFDTFLRHFTGGAPLIFENARKKGTPGVPVIYGTASFLNLAGLSARLTRSPSAANPEDIWIEFTVQDAEEPAGQWRLSQSFPDLPPDSPGLDLRFSEARLIFSARAGTDTDSGASLAAGLNLIGTLAQPGLSGLAAGLLPTGGKRLNGSVVAAAERPQAPALVGRERPWEAGGSIPGLLLSGDVGSPPGAETLGLSDVRFRLYVPPSQAWLAANPTYSGAAALTATLPLPGTQSVGITAELSGGQQLTLVAEPSGVTLTSGLDDLAAVTGGASLAGALPAALKGAAAGLTLEAVGLSLDMTNGAEPVSRVFLGVGFPNAGWHLLPGDTLVLDSIVVEFAVVEPFGQSSVSACVTGNLTICGTRFDAFTQVPDFSVRAELPDGATLPLKSFFTTYLPALPAPPDIHLATLDVFVQPGVSMAFDAWIDGEPGFSIDIAGVKLAFNNLQLSGQKPSGGAGEGHFSGDLSIGSSLHLNATWDSPGDFSITAALPNVALSDLWKAFDEAGLPAPSGFDIRLHDSSLILEEGPDGWSLAAAAQVEGLGLVAVTSAGGESGGLAAGVELQWPQSTPTAGLGFLSDFARLVDLQALMLVVSSLDSLDFSFPDMARFSLPAGPGLKLPPQAGGLAKGFNLYARLGTSKDRGLGALLSFLGIHADGTVGVTVAVSLPDPATNSKLFVAVDETVESVKIVGELGLLMTGGEPGAFLSGQGTASINGQTALFVLAAQVLENGVLVSGSLTGAPITFGPVTLNDLVLIVGLDWEGVPSLGFAGQFDLGRFDGSVAIFLDSEDPAKSLLAGSISDTSLLDIAELLAQQSSIPSPFSNALGSVGVKGVTLFSAPAAGFVLALDNRDLASIASVFGSNGTPIPGDSDKILLVVASAGQSWYLTDRTTMEHYELALDGANVTVKREAQFYLAPQTTTVGAVTFPQGMHVEGEIDELIFKTKIRLEIETSKGISADVQMDPISLWGIVSITGAGGQSGPTLSLATYSDPARADPVLSQPHLAISGGFDILGLNAASTSIKITENGFEFEVSAQASPLLHIDMSGAIDRHSLSSMHASASATAGFDEHLDLGLLGKIHFQETVTLSLALAVANSAPSLTIGGGFDFMGEHVTLPSWSPPSVPPGLLNNLDDVLIDKVRQALLDFLHLDFGKWLEQVKQGLIELERGLEQAAQVMRNVFGQAIDEVAGNLREMTGDMARIAATLAGTFNAAAADVASALRNAGAAAEEVAQGLHQGLGLLEIDVAVAMWSAGCAAGEIAAGLNRGLGTSAAAVARTLLGLDYTAEEVVDALNQGLGMAVADVVGAMRSAQLAAVTVARGLAGGLGMAAANVAGELRDAGYAAEEVAQGVAGGLHMAAADVAGAMRSAGYEAGEIAAGLGRGLGVAAGDVAAVLSRIGFSPQEIGNSLRNVFGLPAEETARILHDTLNLGGDAIRQALGGAGYAADEVERGLGSVVGGIGGALGGVLHKLHL